VTLSFLFFFT